MRRANLPIPLAALLAAAIAPPARSQDWIFADGFECGKTCAWQARVGATDDCTPSVKTVHDIRIAAQPGGPFALSSVVVTARSADGLHYWIADDPVAGAFHGVFVFRGVSAPPLAPTITAGSMVDLVGFTLEFDAQPPGDTLSEVLWGEPALTGASGPLTPVSGLTLLDADAEEFEGVLIEISDAAVTAAGTGDRLTLSDGTGTIVLDDLAFDYAAADYPVGTCFASVTGIAHLDTFLDERQILPRSASDLVVTACP